ncbi:hypothetical protein RJT34_07861 [Clitoria ternatea]|uniref:Uncharacterized protein n=1 Tax=Clitoria ternatea TaxID=43366 RepID=A0AAN9PUH5_CLITE
MFLKIYKTEKRILDWMLCKYATLIEKLLDRMLCSYLFQEDFTPYAVPSPPTIDGLFTWIVQVTITNHTLVQFISI